MLENSSYNNCPIHPSQLLQMVCLQCDQNCVVCPLCMDLHHEKHDLISLKKFMSQEVSKLHHSHINKDVFIQNVERLNSCYANYIEKMRKDIGNEINLLEIFFSEQSERFESEMKFVCGDYNSKKIYDNIIATKKRIKDHAKLPFEEDLVKKVSKLNLQMELAIDDATRQICSIIENLKRFYDSTTDILLDSKRAGMFKFSDQLKHKFIEIQEQNSAINKIFDNSYHTAVIVPPLTPFKNQVTFYVTRSQHKCLWIGLSDLQCIESSQYINSYKHPGYSYWIWEAGYDEQAQYYYENSQNHPFIGWNFDEGDRITVRLIYHKNGSKEVEFIKNYSKSDEQSELMFRAKVNSEVGEYYACVGLGDEGESIKIKY